MPRDKYGSACMGAIVCGSECAKAGLQAGAVSGALFGAADVASARWGAFGRIGARSVAGGYTAEFQGRSFREGAAFPFYSGSLRLAYNAAVNYDISWGPGGAAVEKGPLGAPVVGANNIGIQDSWKFDSNGRRIVGFFEEGGPLSRFANQIPGINTVAGMHDVFQVRLDELGGAWMRGVFNVPGMFLAAGLSYGALADTFVDVPIHPVFRLDDLRR